MMSRTFVAGLALFLLPQLSPAQDTTKKARAWSVEEIHGPKLPFNVTVDEGTWMSLDVSPDGRTIVFDILGDLYTLPIGGGTATRLTSGPGWDAQPRYSPDGSRIVFASDRSGSEQLWLLRVASGTATQMTKDAANQYMSPTWDASGDFVVARRKPNAEGTAAMALLHVGGGTGMLAMEGSGAGPTLSPDGRWLFYGVEGNTGQAIVRVDRRTGEKMNMVAGYESPHRPLVSHNGRLLAYTVIIDAARTLMVRDLERGRDRQLYRGLDMLESWGGDDLDMVPGYAFTPDDGAIIVAADGKIRRVDVATAAATVIPFRATIEQTLTAKVWEKGRMATGPLAPKVLHWAQPLGADRFVFGAIGRLYTWNAATKQATPLATGPGLQYSPALSPDGRWIAYVNWVDTLGGEIRKVPAGGGPSSVVSDRAGRFQSIAWSPDGTKLLLAEERRNYDYMATVNYDLSVVDANGLAKPRFVASVKGRGERKAVPRPVFDAAGTRIYWSEPNAGQMELWSMSAAGEDRKLHARSRYADEMVPSPDGRQVAFIEYQDAFVATLPPVIGKEIPQVGASGANFPVRRLSSDGADYLYWMDGGKSLAWGWASKLSQASVAGDTTVRSTTVRFEVPRAGGKGRVLLRNARLVTMKGDEVIERGDILVDGERIAAIGAAGQVRAPNGTQEIDLAGKTVIPGLIDLHAHYSPAPGMTGLDVYPEQNTELLANLAWGVTTWRDPSARSQTIFTLAEMVEAGTTLGPRIYSTGDIFFVSERVCCGQAKSFEDALGMVRRQKALGAVAIKEHTDPRREQVQWIIEASRQEGLQVIMDPARGPRRELRPILDGATTLEHLYAVTPVKKDVIEVFAKTGAWYVPTLIISTGEDYFITSENPHEDPKVRRFIPHGKIDRDIHQYSRWRMPHEWPGKRHATVVRDILRAGGKVAMGAHGQFQGIGAHWEMWAMAQGGLTPLEAIRASTLLGAEGLGYQDELGSLEVGKFADLVVLDRNPLENLKNSNSVRYVMKGGVMWEGDTMNEVWPQKKTRSRAEWEQR